MGLESEVRVSRVPAVCTCCSLTLRYVQSGLVAVGAVRARGRYPERRGA